MCLKHYSNKEVMKFFNISNNACCSYNTASHVRAKLPVAQTRLLFDDIITTCPYLWIQTIWAENNKMKFRFHHRVKKRKSFTCACFNKKICDARNIIALLVWSIRKTTGMFIYENQNVPLFHVHNIPVKCDKLSFN